MSKYRKWFETLRGAEVQVTADGPSLKSPQVPVSITISVAGDDDGNESQVTLGAHDAMQLRELLAEALGAS